MDDRSVSELRKHHADIQNWLNDSPPNITNIRNTMMGIAYLLTDFLEHQQNILKTYGICPRKNAITAVEEIKEGWFNISNDIKQTRANDEIKATLHWCFCSLQHLASNWINRMKIDTIRSCDLDRAKKVFYGYAEKLATLKT